MMRLRNIYGIIAILAVALSASAQKSGGSKRKADALFERKSYLKAATMYEALDKPDRQTLQNLGDCYYNNFMMKDAVRVYGAMFLDKKDSTSAEYYFKFAHALMGTDNYKRADSVMALYLKYPVDSPAFIKNLKNNVPYNYEIQPMAKNSGNGDFGLSFYGDKVAFASYRNPATGEYNWNDHPYLDLFEAVVDDKEQLTKVQPFPKEINTKAHESSAAFSPDGKYMYFSRTADKQVKVEDEKFAPVKLMRAEFVNGKWENIIALPFNGETFSCEHPTLTKDGKKMYFSSDMPGGQGSFDMYVVDVNEDGTFGTPANLGNTVNSKHREQFPFINPEGNLLYFASDGHQGLGGLDIFVSQNYDGQFAKPLDLGETINSGMDDFGYVVDEAKNKGYLSSNRKGSDNLYSFIRKENADSHVVEGDVRDKNTSELLPGTTVTLYDENDKLIGSMVVGAQGDYVFNTEPNKKYRIEAVRDFYIPHSEEFTTNEQGKLRYTIELFVECYDDAEEIITKRQDGKVQIMLENIYFDLNKWDIKPEAAEILNVLYDLMVKYPEMEIEVGAHTDSRASNMYNKLLSNKRAAATLEYLVQKGINRKRMKSHGYGEEMPLIKCGEERPCTEQEHSINRRCEFIILK
ncbi:OmpA family protein [Flavobacterium silvaticum]|uniref:OmpA family protein n=1 Tax=Flavobacterium silvaticum TaxID=1852020 RepID=A0A972FSY2_9FLAO|nr:OmpA family protein [Flavobacterium silvaticum]NMH27893.1 OmpA family protein [Flavobacterium silvaticum]